MCVVTLFVLRVCTAATSVVFVRCFLPFIGECRSVCGYTADRSGCPNSICAGDRPPSRGVFRYSRRPRWKFSSSSSPLTVDAAMSFIIAFTAVQARPLDWGLCAVCNIVLTPSVSETA